VIASKKISIDIASDNQKEEINESFNQKVANKVIPKKTLMDRWEDFLDEYANSQFQLTSLSHINVDFEDNGILLYLSSELFITIILILLQRKN